MNETWGILGNSWAVDMLRQHVARDVARHAYLIAGPQGIGRRTLALRFAQALNCTQPVGPGIPCGTCRDCVQIEALQHPDLAIIQAAAEGRVLKVEQIREARRSLALKPYQSSHRVSIFLRFEEANDSASNALLKVLEEAPAYAVLILTAHSPEGLLPTIVSRCEVLRLRPLPWETVESFLKQRGVADQQAQLVAHLSGGRPGLALRMLEDPAAMEFRSERLSDLRTLLSATRAQKFAYASRLAGDRSTMRGTLLLWLSFWRDVLWRASGAHAPVSNLDCEPEIGSIAQGAGLAKAQQAVASLDRAIARLDGGINPRLLAEVLLLDLPH